MILIVQLTGRMHFAVARGFDGMGKLLALVTDLAVPHWVPGWLVPAGLVPYHRIVGKCTPVATGWIGVFYRLHARVWPSRLAVRNVWASRRLARRAYRLAQGRGEWPEMVFSFDIQALETFRLFRPHGSRLVLEQCVASRLEQAKVLELTKGQLSNAEYSERKTQLDAMSAREAAEWELADVIVCPSGYVRETLIEGGVADAKIRVVPYGYSPKGSTSKGLRSRDGGVLRLLFVGTVEPRKGFGFLLDALALLQSRGCEVELAVFGKIVGWGQRGVPPNVRLFGHRPHLEVVKAFQSSDVFVLPSLLEGSATVVYEALSYGLPCVVTRETGSVVSDGFDGLVVPRANSRAIASAIEYLDKDRGALAEMARKAVGTASRFTRERYFSRLREALGDYSIL